MLTAPFRNLKERFHLTQNDKILDVGGSATQITEIPVDTLVDILSPEEFAKTMPASLRAETKLLAKHFVRLDLGVDRFPFPDKHFDFCICTHTLEDLFDPRLALREMERVAKRGFILTPSRGSEMVFTDYDITDWLTGGRRLPGHSHHHWFMENKDNCLVITPKHYPLLYTPEFHIVKWYGEPECEYSWEDQMNIKFWDSVNFRDLLRDYRTFVSEHRALLKHGRTLFWVDRPYTMAIALYRRLRRRGYGYELMDQ